MFKLIIEQGDQPCKEVILREGENLIGRSRESSVQLLADDVSSRQANVIVRGSNVWVVNLSRFGTWIDDNKLETTIEAEILPNQCIRIGKKSVLRLVEMGAPATLAEENQPTAESVKKVRESAVAVSTVGGGAVTVAPTGQPTLQDDVTGVDLAQGLDAPSANPPVEFDRVMRAKAEAADLNEEPSESSDGKTQARKTGFIPQEDIHRRILQERAKPRQRILISLGVLSLGVVVFFLLRPRQSPEGKYEWDKTYSEGNYPMPTGGYGVTYPKNETTKEPEIIAGGLTITTQLGRKRDVPLVLTLHEEINDRWALQESSQTMDEWMRANTDKIFDRPSTRFEGQQNGVRIWNAMYKRRDKTMVAGRASLFCDGQRLSILCAEIPVAGQARAENFLYYSYFDFPAAFEESHWEGRAPSTNVSATTLLSQVRADLRREAPATWAMVERQLKMILCNEVAGKNAVEEKEAVRLLVGLRKQEARWYNSQQLQVINARRFREKERIQTLAQRCQAVFSDTDDRRYYEVRAWERD